MSLLVSFKIYDERASLMGIELLDAVRASLRAKVAGLSEDNWMYEAEDDSVLR